jgi:hypothetical protein
MLVRPETVTVGLSVRLEAKPGRETDLEALLRRAAPLAEAEPATHGLPFGSDPRHSESLMRFPMKRAARAMWDDISKRPYITVGFTAWATMVPLTITSTAGMIRRLGGKRWTRLHRVVYATAVLGAMHYWWSVRADVRRPLAYAAVIALLLTLRAYWKRAHAVPPGVRCAPLVQQSATGARKAS